MPLVSAATDSRYPNRQQSHDVHAAMEKGDGEPGKDPAINLLSLAEQQIDNLELSSDLRALMDGLNVKFSQLLDEYPQFRQLFLGKGRSHQGRSEVFLADPQLQTLKEKNPEFSQFFDRIQDLALQSGELLKEIRNLLRNPRETATYHHLMGRKN